MGIQEILHKYLNGNQSRQCDCKGCKISRDPRSGYQPCHKKCKPNPPGAE